MNSMVNVFLSIILILLGISAILLLLGAISVPICFVGYIIEETKDNDDGFFHKVVEAINW